MIDLNSFQKFNETDVREEIIAPLIRKLGYQSGTSNNVIREQPLRYPHIFIGRKDFKKDPILRGKADYILEAGSVRWVIEAKAPDVAIDVDAIEQAYTYANHPEVRAVYFVLCNGRTLIIYQTNMGPTAQKILELKYEDFDAHFHKLSNLLSPTSIISNHPQVVPDPGIPIGNGLRSVARVTNGLIGYHSSSINMPALTQMQTSIFGGGIERDENGHLVALFTTIAPTRSIQQLNERLGLTKIEMFSQDSCIPSDKLKPTIFRLDQTATFPEGERLLDINTWQEVQLPCNMTCRVIAEASGYLEKNRFFGTFNSDLDYKNLNQQISLKGTFEIFVA